MMWVSTLETMAVSFIMDLDGYCGKKAQSSADANVDIQLEGTFLVNSYLWNTKNSIIIIQFSPIQLRFGLHYSVCCVFFIPHTEPVGDEFKDVGKTAKSCRPSDPPDDYDLLKLILDKVKAVQQEAEHLDKDKTKPGCFRRLAKIIDTAFFVLYVLVIVLFIMYMIMLWENMIWFLIIQINLVVKIENAWNVYLDDFLSLYLIFYCYIK